MKMISWNVNGLRACIQKGFLEQFRKLDVDFFCLQETKLQPGQLELDLPGYEQYWCYAEKKGYSGTAIFTKHTPLSVSYGLGVPELDNEGRLITLEYPEFYLVTCYTPNAQRGLARIEHRMRWDAAFRSYIDRLDQEKPVILCGDLNVAHKEIDLKNPGSNRGNAGFSDEERDSFSKTLGLGFTDTFRHLHPDTTGAYTWWSYMFHARENNAGWRIDYFLVSDRIRDAVYKTPIYPDIMGSDHCPVGLELDIKCNGSIWSPENIGLQTPSVIEAESKSKKKAPALKAGAIAILLLSLLIGIGILTLSNTSSENELFSVHLYSSALEYSEIRLTIVRSAGFLDDGETRWIIDAEKMDFRQMLSYHPINFWLRIDLTEKGLETVDQTINPSITISLSQYSDASESPLFHNEFNTCYTIQRYYLDSGIVGGWFVYGFVPYNANAKIEIQQSDRAKAVAKHTLSITPYFDSDQSLEQLLNTCLSSNQLYSCYAAANNLAHYQTLYRSVKTLEPCLAELEYYGYEAVQLMYEQFFRADSMLLKYKLEAILSLDIYNNQLTEDQLRNFLSSCSFYKNERFMEADPAG